MLLFSGMTEDPQLVPLQTADWLVSLQTNNYQPRESVMQRIQLTESTTSSIHEQSS